MNFPLLLKRLEKLTRDNSPTILTTIGATGVIATAILTVKSTFRASDILRDDSGYETEPLTRRETVEMVWKEYIPPAVVGGLTIAAIIGANRIGTGRTAALAAAYSLSERAMNDYQTKVVETLGEVKEQKVRDAVAQDRATAATENGESRLVILGPGDQLCFDSWSGRYFRSDMESLKHAMNKINHQIIGHDYASLADWYNAVGISPTPNSYELGWNNDKLLDVKFSSVIADDGKPALSCSFRTEPIREYQAFH